MSGTLNAEGGAVPRRPPGERHGLPTIERSAWARFVDSLALALAFGLVTGWLHVAVVAYRRGVINTFTWTSADFAWTTPLGYALVFAVAGLPTALAVAAVPRRAVDRAMTWCIAWLATLSFLLLFQRLSQWSALVLAAGIAVPLSQLVAAGRHRMAIRSLAAVLAIATMATFAVKRGGAALRERGGRAAITPARDVPNVLLLVLDTVRSMDLSLYGYTSPTTPVLDSLASESVVFDRAFSTASWTFPSHASMFTGRYRHELDLGRRQPLRERYRTVATAVNEGGYATGGFVANVWYTGSETGLGQGFMQYRDFRVSVQQFVLGTTLGQTPVLRNVLNDHSPAGLLNAVRDFSIRNDPLPRFHQKRAVDVAEEFLAWQAGVDDRPFFAFLNLYDAHEYQAPDEFLGRFAGVGGKRGRYDGAIAYMDREIGRILAQLRERDVLDRTVVIVTSDHGELFGEHGQHGHGNSLWQPVLHVPLLIRLPRGEFGGQHVSGEVSLRDLAATILDLTGRGDDESGIPGTSLAHTWRRGSTTRPSPVVAAFGGPPEAQVSLIGDGQQFIEWSDGEAMLLELATEGSGERDLTGAPPHAGALDSLRELVRSLVPTWPPPPADSGHAPNGAP